MDGPPDPQPAESELLWFSPVDRPASWIPLDMVGLEPPPVLYVDSGTGRQIRSECQRTALCEGREPIRRPGISSAYPFAHHTHPGHMWNASEPAIGTCACPAAGDPRAGLVWGAVGNGSRQVVKDVHFSLTVYRGAIRSDSWWAMRWARWSERWSGWWLGSRSGSDSWWATRWAR